MHHLQHSCITREPPDPVVSGGAAPLGRHHHNLGTPATSTPREKDTTTTRNRFRLARLLPPRTPSALSSLLQSTPARHSSRPPIPPSSQTPGPGTKQEQRTANPLSPLRVDWTCGPKPRASGVSDTHPRGRRPPHHLGWPGSGQGRGAAASRRRETRSASFSAHASAH